MNFFTRTGYLLFISQVCLGLVLGFANTSIAADISPLPELTPRENEPEPTVEERMDKLKAAVGKRLFFDQRLSGDTSLSCATCHDPKEGFTKNVALDDAYTGSRHFRNAPTLINTKFKKDYGIAWHWEGRIGTNLSDITRDQITDSYVMNMDMRLMQERLKQDPVYVEMFKKAELGEPSSIGVLKAIPKFLDTIVSVNAPYDNNQLSGAAKSGEALFKGKAGCVECHNGPMFSDGKPHNTAVPENPDIFSDPLRHVTYLTYMYSLGTENRFNWRRDVGYFVVTHYKRDIGKFITPTLRELGKTGPFMHNGIIGSLDAVLEFYNNGGGSDRPGLKDQSMKKLDLSSTEKHDLKQFLLSLTGDNIGIEAENVDQSYTLVEDWDNVKN